MLPKSPRYFCSYTQAGCTHSSRNEVAVRMLLIMQRSLEDTVHFQTRRPEILDGTLEPGGMWGNLHVLIAAS
jgi:hypothetical protein